jgi:hypothetical protein
MQLFVLGIPCIYYGTEQALIGRPPEPSEKDFLPDGGIADYYLREAMFGPENPRKSGTNGLGAVPGSLDTTLPGFGSFGTHGRHCFDPAHPAFVRIASAPRNDRDSQTISGLAFRAPIYTPNLFSRKAVRRVRKKLSDGFKSSNERKYQNAQLLRDCNHQEQL